MDDLINRQDAIDIIYAESRLANSEVAEEYAEMYAYALRGVPSTQPEQQWIPCSAGFPEDWEKVLVTTKDGAIQFGFHHGKYWAYGAKVIAWMPLPEPYKAESEDK